MQSVDGLPALPLGNRAIKPPDGGQATDAQQPAAPGEAQRRTRPARGDGRMQHATPAREEPGTLQAARHVVAGLGQVGQPLPLQIVITRAPRDVSATGEGQA